MSLLLPLGNAHITPGPTSSTVTIPAQTFTIPVGKQKVTLSIPEQVLTVVVQ